MVKRYCNKADELSTRPDCLFFIVKAMAFYMPAVIFGFIRYAYNLYYVKLREVVSATVNSHDRHLKASPPHVLTNGKNVSTKQGTLHRLAGNREAGNVQTLQFASAMIIQIQPRAGLGEPLSEQFGQ